MPLARLVNLLAPIGKLAVGTVCPSEAIEVVNAFAISDIVLLWVAELIGVFVATGLPATNVNVPEPFLLKMFSCASLR